MSSPSPPPPPDYTPVVQGQQAVAASDLEAAKIQAEVAREQLGLQREYAERSTKIAERQQQVSEEQRQFGLSEYNKMYPYLQNYMQGQLDFQKAAQKNQEIQNAEAERARARGEETYQRYMTEFAPRETQFAKEAFDYNSPARMDQAAAAARGDVKTAFQAARDNAERQLMSYGVSPGEGAFGRNQALRISEAASAAAAGTTARERADAAGKQYQVAALQVGQKLPAQAIGLGQYGIQATTSGLSGATIGGGGVQAANQALQSGTYAQGSPAAYAGLSNPYTTLSGAFGSSGNAMYGNQIAALGNAGTAFGQLGTVLNNSYSNQLEAYKAESAASPLAAIGRIAGSVAPIAAKAAFGFPL